MTTRILLLGKSVFIAGLEASLTGLPDLAVARREQLEADDLPKTDLVLTDLSENKDLRDLIRLSGEAERTLVGIDPATGKATVLSGQSASMASMQELMEFLQKVEIKHIVQRRLPDPTEPAPIS
jgi:hypothetical protein